MTDFLHDGSNQPPNNARYLYTGVGAGIAILVN